MIFLDLCKANRRGVNTLIAYEVYLRRYLLPVLAKRRLDEVKPADITAIKKGLAPKSHNTMCEMLVLLGMDGGLRRGEIVGLQWSDIDLGRGILVVRHNIVRGKLDVPKGRSEDEVALTRRLTTRRQCLPPGAVSSRRQGLGDPADSVQDAAPVLIDLDHALTAADVRARLLDQGFAVLTPSALARLTGHALADLAALARFWDDLPHDRYLRDLGHYRSRRHGCAIVHVGADEARVAEVPHRAHWQSTAYNALHGGLERWFEPIDPRMAGAAVWRDLIANLGRCVAGVRAPADARWYVEGHPFRIDTSEGVGRPTPEGAHRDGVDFVAVILVGRHAITGGETRVFEAAGPRGVRFTLDTPWTAVLLDDTRVIHESTPIQTLTDDARGHRDTLVLTYRAGGFQAPQGGS